MPTEEKPSYSLETLTLEILSTFSLLERLKEDFGVVTQWESGAWLIMRFLKDQGRCRFATLCREQHISEEQGKHLVDELVAAEMISVDQEHPSSDPAYTLARDGEQAIKKIQVVLHEALGRFENQFDPESLKIAVETLTQYRHILECSKI